MGPPAHEQPTLRPSPAERRRERLGEAVRQARAAAGRDAVMRVLEVDPESRVPERRALLTPFPDP
jgi:protein ImuB